MGRASGAGPPLFRPDARPLPCPSSSFAETKQVADRRPIAYMWRMTHPIGEGQTADSPLKRIVEDFSLLDEWEDRYRYVIELGRTLPPMSESERTPENKVQGCVSQVWVATDTACNGGPAPVLHFRGDSDAHIVRGLIAILFALYSGKSAQDILGIDAIALLSRLGLEDHLTPQRSNGLRAMVERIRVDAQSAITSPANG